MAERIANGPRSADELAHLVLSAETLEAFLVILGERMIVPADGAANLDATAIDAAGGVVRGRDAAGDPVPQPAKPAQLVRHGPHAGACLSFQLHEIQFGNAALRPQIGRQANGCESVALE